MLMETYGYPLDLLKSVVVTRIMSGVEPLGYLPVFGKYVKKDGRWYYCFELMDGETIENPVDSEIGELAEGHAHRECILLNRETDELSLLVSLADNEEEAKKGLDAELVRVYFEKRGIKEKMQVDELVDWFMEYMEKGSFGPIYGIHEGVARDGNIIAATFYMPEDYVQMFGKTIEEYKDYLLERHIYLEEMIDTEPVKVTHVPFDPGDYARWLEENSFWRDSSEARSAWALEKAKNPAALRALSEKYPVRPAAPVEEEREARVFCVLVPLLLTDEDEVRLAGRRLPREHLSALASELKRIFAGAEEYTKISSLRCRGMKMFIGERFVPVSDADEAETLLEQEALKLVDDESAGPFLSVPPSCRVCGSKLLDSVRGDKFALVPVMLPVILVGSASELNYCENLLEGEELEQVSGIVCDMINGMFTAEIDGPMPVVPIWEAEIIADEMLSSITEREEIAPDFPGRARETNKAKLKRIK